MQNLSPGMMFFLLIDVCNTQRLVSLDNIQIDDVAEPKDSFERTVKKVIGGSKLKIVGESAYKDKITHQGLHINLYLTLLGFAQNYGGRYDTLMDIYMENVFGSNIARTYNTASMNKLFTGNMNSINIIGLRNLAIKSDILF